MVNLTRVRFEHHSDIAIGIGESTPRISWSFEGEDQNWSQSSYELEILRQDGITEKFTVESGDNILVPWSGRPLTSRERAEVRVRVTGSDGLPTAWSEKVAVEAGLLESGDWQCSLIEPKDPYVPGPPHKPVVFRREIQLNKKVSRARLYITAHGVYEAQIGNRKVGDHVLAPGWTSYRHRLTYQTFEITDHLHDGSNTIDVQVAEGWYCGRLGFGGGWYNIYGDSIGLIAKAVVTYEDGEEVQFGTDENWTWSYGSIQSSGIYDGETYDANADITPSSVWSAVKTGPISDNLVSPDGPPVRKMQERVPVDIIKSPLGKTIVDLGQNIVGWVRVAVDGPLGTAIELQFAEVLEHGEVATRPLRHCKARDKLILSGNGPITWEPKFTFHGFRYVEVENWPGELKLENITGIVVHTDMVATGAFACSHPLLNRLHDNVIWSMRGNFLSIPTDCPQRDERLGWTGDINAFADTANFLYDTTGMLSSWLRDLSAEQVAWGGGIVPLVVPNILERFGKDAHAIWGDAAVMVPWSIYLATDDKSLLSRQYSSMKAWLDSIPRRSNGLWNYTSQWKLGDWLDPAAPPEDCGNATTDPTLVSDAFLIRVVTLLGDTSVALGLASDTKLFTTMAHKLREEFAREYITPAGLLAADTQTAYALAICFSLFPSANQEKYAGERLEHIIRVRSRFKIATGFAGTPFVGHALTKLGKNNLIYRMLMHRKSPSWLYPVTMGATTIWERWDSMLPDGSINPGEMTSFNHYALGAVANWMHSVILGLKAVEPGWRVFNIAPIPGAGLKFAKGSYLSPYGECAVKWAIKGSDDSALSFWIRIRVPPNTKAQVTLPGSEQAKIVGSGEYTWEIPYQPEEWPPRAAIPPNQERDDELPEGEHQSPPDDFFE